MNTKQKIIFGVGVIGLFYAYKKNLGEKYYYLIIGGVAFLVYFSNGKRIIKASNPTQLDMFQEQKKKENNIEKRRYEWAEKVSRRFEDNAFAFADYFEKLKKENKTSAAYLSRLLDMWLLLMLDTEPEEVKRIVEAIRYKHGKNSVVAKALELQSIRQREPIRI
jgi:signal recognition particle GTPase